MSLNVEVYAAICATKQVHLHGRVNVVKLKVISNLNLPVTLHEDSFQLQRSIRNSHLWRNAAVLLFSSEAFGFTTHCDDSGPTSTSSDVVKWARIDSCGYNRRASTLAVQQFFFFF